jgi:hypothetical protein
MEPGSYRSSSSGERASERQRRLTVNQSGHMPVRRFESCRSHSKRAGDTPCPVDAHEGQKL